MKKTLNLSATLENLESFQEHVRYSAVTCGFDAKQLQQVELALEEILVNVIRYAYPEDRVGDIEVSCTWKSGQDLTIKVIDCGSAFDPLAKSGPDTSLALDEREVGGLGIFLTRKMMDEVTYERSQDKNILTMVKRCSK